MSLNAGEVYALFGAKVDPTGFAQFDARMKKSIASSASAEQAMVSSAKRIDTATKAMGAEQQAQAAKTVAAQERMAASAARTAGVYQDASGKWREANGRFVSSARQAELGLKQLDQQQQITSRGIQTAMGKTVDAQRQGTIAQDRYDAANRRSQESLRAVGQTAKVATGGGLLALGAIVVSSVRKAGDFEAAMRNVNSIAKLSEDSLRSLSTEVQSMAGRTGQAPKVLAEGLYDIVSSGFDATDGLKVLDASAKAATAGLTDTATSTKAVVAVLNSYHLGAEDAGKVSDELFQIVNQGVITFPELARQIGDVLPFASSLGVGLDELGGAISTITKGGTGASQTMTQVKSVFNQLLSPSTALQKAIKDTGSSSAESLLKTKGFQGTLEALVGTTDGSKASIQKLFPDVEALGGVLRLTGKNASDARDDLKAMSDASGSTQSAFAEQSKSYEVQAQKFSAAWQAAQITIGQAVLPTMTKATQEAAKFVSELSDSGKLTEWSQDLLSGGKTAVQVLGDVAGAAADAGHVGAQAAGGILAVARALNIDAPTGIEAALAAMAGFKIAGVVAPMVATLATNIRLLRTAPTAGALVGDLAAMVNPYTAAAIAVSGIAAGIVLLASEESDETRIARENAQAHKEQADAIRSVNDAERAAAGKGLSKEQAELNLDRAKEATHQAIMGKGGKKSDAYVQARHDERQAALDAKEAADAYTKSINEQNTANDSRVTRAQKRLTEAQREAEAANSKIAGTAADKVTVGRGGGVQMGTTNANQVKLAAEAQGNLVARIKEYDQAISRANVSDASRQRLMQGASQIQERYASGISTVINALDRQGVSAQKQATILGGSQKALSEAGRLISDGASTKQVIKVLADTSDAKSQLQGLKGIADQLRDKKIRVAAQTGDAYDALAAIQSVKLRDKVAKVLGSSEDAESKIHALIALGIPRKTAFLMASNLTAAGIAAALAALERVPHDKTVTITTVLKTFKSYENRAPSAGHAKGRGPGKGETALVGEGRHAREAIVDPARGTAFMVDRPTILDLPDTAYVIPEDPGMRGGALGLLQMLAGDLGLRGFKDGKAPHYRPSKKKGDKAARQLKVPEKVTYAAVSEAELRDDVTEARENWKKRDKSIKSYEDKVIKDRAGLKKANKITGKGKKKAVGEAQDKLDKDQAHLSALKNGGQGLRSAQAVYNVWREQSKLLKKLQAANREIERLNTIQETDRQKMSNAAGRGDEKAYGVAQADRTGILKQLKATYEKAVGLAKDGSKFKADLESKLASVEGDLQDAATTYADAAPAGSQAETEADRIADTGMTDAERARLSGIEKDVSLAGLTETLDDDKAAAGEKESFLGGILGLLTSGARSVSNSVVIDVADQYKAARDNLLSLTTGGTSNSNPDLQAQLDQERERNRVLTDESRLNRRALEVFGGSGDIGAGGINAMQAARGQAPVTVNINTLHPGSPQVAQAVASAAVAGFGYQNPRPSKRQRIG